MMGVQVRRKRLKVGIQQQSLPTTTVTYLCHTITNSLSEIIQARKLRRMYVRKILSSRYAAVLANHSNIT